MSFFGIGRKRGEKGRRGEKRRGGRKREEEGGGGRRRSNEEMEERQGRRQGRREEKRRKEEEEEEDEQHSSGYIRSRIRVTQYDTLTGSGVTELTDPRGDTDVEPRGEADVVEEVLRSVEDLDTTRCGCLVVLALR